MCRELEAGSIQAFFRIRSLSLQSQRDPELCGSAEPGPDNRCDRRAAHQWPMVQEMADAYYEPGVFTTFTAFEYSAVHPTSGGWLHRNVFFRGEDVPPWGGAALGWGHSPERLWEWMDEACTGGLRRDRHSAQHQLRPGRRAGVEQLRRYAVHNGDPRAAGRGASR